MYMIMVKTATPMHTQIMRFAKTWGILKIRRTTVR